MVGLERTTARSDSCGGVLAAVVSLSIELQFVLKRLGVAHTETWLPYLISENILLESHPDLLICLVLDSINKPSFTLEGIEKTIHEKCKINYSCF